MGRRKQKSKHRRRQAAQAVARYHEQTLRRELEDSLLYESHKEHQSKYLAKVAELERDILSRTIFVTQVKDLNQAQNLMRLRSFFQTTYGPVEECVKAKFKKRGKRNTTRFPPARVRFYRKADAEKIFGGKNLLQVLQDRNIIKIVESTVGFRGCLRVRPVEPYHGMVEHLLSDSVITMNATSFSMGHWFSEFEDTYDTYELDASSTSGLEGSQFLEEAVVNTGVRVKLDLKTRTVQLEVNADPSSLLLFGSHIISFRFKAIQGFIDLCVDSCNPNSFSFVFRLKHPPKIHAVSDHTLLFNVEGRERRIDIPGLNHVLFGTCFSYKLNLTKHEAEAVLDNENIMEKLRSFGILRSHLFSIEASETISTVHIGSSSGHLQDHFQKIDDEKSGKANE